MRELISNIVTVVQARMGSSRLPGKVMLPLAGEPLLVRMVERVQAARLVGTRAVIVMPTRALPVKVEGVRRLAAEIIVEGTTSVDVKARAEREAATTGLTMIPPFEHERVIAGQGTVGLEILEQASDVTTVFVPVGGGGLLSSVG